MNLFFNYNNLDMWLKENTTNHEKNIFLTKSKNNEIYDLFKEYIEKNNINISNINSINIVISFKNYKEVTEVDADLLIEFNKEWNLNLLRESQKFISFCRVHNKFFNFIFIYHQNGKQNIANIAMTEILKSFILGLHNETRPFKFFSKLIILDRSKKKYLKKIGDIVLNSKKIIISNSKLLSGKKNYKYVLEWE